MSYLNNKRSTAYFYTFLIMLIFTIPSFFAIKFAIDKELIKKELLLEKYTNEISKNIYSNNFTFSNSVKIKFALFDEKGNLVKFNLSHTLKSHDFESLVSYPYLYYKKKINTNKQNISYIISQIEINYSKIIFIALIIFFIILANIYLLNKIIIQNTAKPYEEVQKYMNSFFNDTMHELKTPLGVININLDLLVRKNEHNKYTKRIKTAIKQMQVTYEDLEYYIKNKRVTYPKEKLLISEYIKSRITFFEDLALSKQMRINSNLDKDIYIYINILEIQRVIDNTISNAIKYSDMNTEINISLSKNNEFCYLVIKDEGYGIKNKKEVFNRFTREDKAQGGFGLGLSIIKNICNKNNIQIDIQSKENIGSTFTYKIKLYKNKFLDRFENEIK